MKLGIVYYVFGDTLVTLGASTVKQCTGSFWLPSAMSWSDSSVWVVLICLCKQCTLLAVAVDEVDFLLLVIVTIIFCFASF